MTTQTTIVAVHTALAWRAVPAAARELARLLAAACARWLGSRYLGWRTRRELSRLPDGMLRDIGLTRCEIEAVATDNYR